MTNKVIAFGCDHAGLPLKKILMEAAQAFDHYVIDLGTHSTDSVDYPDFAHKVADALKTGEAALGVLICGTGIGMSMAANRHPDIRAAVCHDVHSAHQCVEHDDVNVMCIGAQIVGPWLAKDLIAAYLHAKFSTAEEFRRRVAKLADMDAGR